VPDVEPGLEEPAVHPSGFGVRIALHYDAKESI
jgi:hypothetical protein